MLEIYIDGKLADWNADTDSVNLVKELGDTDALTSTSSEYSYELELPATLNNNIIMGFKNEIDVSGKFVGEHKAQIHDGGVCLFNGNMLLTEITKDAYKCNFCKKGKAPLTDLLGDKQLSEITPHWKMVSTYEDIQHINDWHIGGTETTLDTDDTHITFPYMPRNLPMNPTTETRKNFQQVENALINDENAYPAYSVTGILKDMFSSYGYKVDGNIFDDPRFTNLYESASTKDWNGNGRYQPCYLEMHMAQYLNSLSNTSYSAEDPNYSMRIGYDRILRSGEGIGVLNDTNQMVAGGVITVPRTGWYKVRMNGTINQSDTRNGLYTNTARNLYFPSSNVSDDPTSLSYNPVEITLTKTRDEIGYLSKAMGEYSTTEEAVNTVGTWSVGKTDDKATHTFPTNNGTLRVDDDGLICGARIGSYRGHDTSSLPANRRHGEANVLNIINPANATSDRYFVNGVQTAKHDIWDVRWNMSHYFQDREWRNDITYGKDSGLAVFGKNTLYNEKSDNVFHAKTETWREDAKQRMSGELLYSDVHTTGEYSGRFDVSCLAYLKKGDTLDINIVSPYVNGENIGGIAQIEMRDFRLWMGLVNTEDDWWKPSYDEELAIGESKPTNVNALLGTRKCADWLKNLCQTFNLSVTENGTDSYLIDTQSDISRTTNIIGIDDKAHPHDAVFKRIDLPSKYSFRFTNKEDEHGPMATNRDGGKEYLNPSNTTGEEQVVESKYSYNWYFPIDFEGIGERMVPIACDDKRYENPAYTYKKCYEEGDFDPTPRLMYVPRTAEMISYPYLPLLVPSDTMVGLTLDFDSISDTFFSVTFPNSYEVEVELYLNQSDYANINLGTKVSFNGNLYKVSKVDGFDVSQENPCKLTLVSIV